MYSFKHSLGVLMRKHLKERSRRFCHTLFEITSGVAVFFLIFLMRRIQVSQKISVKQSLVSDDDVDVFYVPHHQLHEDQPVLPASGESQWNKNITFMDPSKAARMYVTSIQLSKSKQLRTIHQFLIVCTVIAPLPFFLFTSSRLVNENRNGLKELMKLVGVSPNILRASQLLDTLIIATVYATLITVLLKVTAQPILPYSNSFIIGFTIILHFLNTTLLAFITSTLSQDYQHADGLALLVYIMTFVIDSLWHKNTRQSDVVKYAMACFLPHAPMYLFWDEIGHLEQIGQGVHFENIFQMLTSHCTPIVVVWVFYFIQMVNIMILAWYLDLIRPGRYGAPEKWNFVFKKRYWSKKKKRVAFHVTVEQIVHIMRDLRYFEPGPKRCEITMKMINLTKVFKSFRQPNVVALDKVTMDVYKGEITVLLGPNGAGKTTLLSIITGMDSQTSGKVYINGFDTTTRIQEVRQELGFCPQYNLTFDHLTVRENIVLFEQLKCISGGQERADALMKELKIYDKADFYSYQLSTGMKRCLQVACALAVDADILVLDEPSTGMDHTTRHILWDMLLNLRHTKTILMTTTIMEEADILGDRIAILYKGKLNCYGSPTFLKNVMGSGCKVTLTMRRKRRHNKKPIIDLIQTSIPESTYSEYGEKRLVFTLPSKEHELFPKLFDTLEEKRKELGIANIEVGMSMEEVFLEFINRNKEPEPIVVNYSVFQESSEKLHGWKLLQNQYNALMRRHFAFVWSKKYQFMILQILVPVLGIMLISSSTNKLTNLHITTNFNVTATTTNIKQPKSVALCVGWVLWVVFLSTLPISPLIWMSIREYREGIRYLWITAGCHRFVLWSSKFLVQLVIYIAIIPPSVLISAYFFDSDKTFNNGPFLGAVLLMLMVFGPAFILLCFLMSFFLQEEHAISVVYLLSLVLGVIVPLFVYLIESLTKYYTWIDVFYVIIQIAAYLFPVYAFSTGLCEIAMVARLNAFCALNKHLCPDLVVNETMFNSVTCCASSSAAPFKFYSKNYLASLNLGILIGHFIIYSYIVYLIQNRTLSSFFDHMANYFYKPLSKLFIDPRVESEEEYVAQKMEYLLPRNGDPQGNETSDVLLVHKLHRNYVQFCWRGRSCHAVNGISFSVKKGECFGILGPNGAGKTSTLKMIAGYTTMTRGNSWLSGWLLTRSRSEYIRLIGYGGLDETTSGHKGLTLLGILNGRSDRDARRLALSALTYMGLQSYGTRAVSTYSSGCQRRLWFSAMLMTSPHCLLFDEPTEGVDAASSPKIADALHDMLDAGKAIVLASQSMDWKEMEAFCSHVALMSKGEFATLGEPAKVKDKYATGYAANLKLNMKPAQHPLKKRQYSMEESSVDIEAIKKVQEAAQTETDGSPSNSKIEEERKKERKEQKEEERIEALKTRFEELFETSILNHEHKRMLYYHIVDTENNLLYSELFKKLELLKHEFPDILVEYSLSETSIKEVFMMLDAHRRSMVSLATLPYV